MRASLPHSLSAEVLALEPYGFRHYGSKLRPSCDSSSPTESRRRACRSSSPLLFSSLQPFMSFVSFVRRGRPSNKGLTQRLKNKVSVIGTDPLNLAEFVSMAEGKDLEINVPLPLLDMTAEPHPSLCVCPFKFVSMSNILAFGLTLFYFEAHAFPLCFSMRNSLYMYLSLSQKNQTTDPVNEQLTFSYDSKNNNGKLVVGIAQDGFPVDIVKHNNNCVSPAKIAQAERQSSAESGESSSSSD